LDISRRILSKRGFSVITANRGETGLGLAVEKQPDIVVLDVIMPEMDGWQVLEKLRDIPETANIPIIMQSMLSERELALAKGADEYLTKPVDQSDLTNAVRKLLPEPSLGRGLLVIEDGSRVKDLLQAANNHVTYDLLHTADLKQADTWAQEREFGIIIVGQHPEMENVSKFMEKVAGASDTPPTPVLLLNSIQMESLDSEQLLSYINLHQRTDTTDQ